IFSERGSGAFAGRGAVRHAKVLDGNQIELGYALLPTFWGTGLATEMAGAMVAVARDELALAELAAWTLAANRASQRRLEKSGFVYGGDFELDGLPHRCYRVVFGPSAG